MALTLCIELWCPEFVIRVNLVEQAVCSDLVNYLQIFGWTKHEICAKLITSFV